MTKLKRFFSGVVVTAMVLGSMGVNVMAVDELPKTEVIKQDLATVSERIEINRQNETMTITQKGKELAKIYKTTGDFNFELSDKVVDGICLAVPRLDADGKEVIEHVELGEGVSASDISLEGNFLLKMGDKDNNLTHNDLFKMLVLEKISLTDIEEAAKANEKMNGETTKESEIMKFNAENAVKITEVEFTKQLGIAASQIVVGEPMLAYVKLMETTQKKDEAVNKGYFDDIIDRIIEEQKRIVEEYGNDEIRKIELNPGSDDDKVTVVKLDKAIKVFPITNKKDYKSPIIKGKIVVITNADGTISYKWENAAQDNIYEADSGTLTAEEDKEIDRRPGLHNVTTKGGDKIDTVGASFDRAHGVLAANKDSSLSIFGTLAKRKNLQLLNSTKFTRQSVWGATNVTENANAETHYPIIMTIKNGAVKQIMYGGCFQPVTVDNWENQKIISGNNTYQIAGLDYLTEASQKLLIEAAVEAQSETRAAKAKNEALPLYNLYAISTGVDKDKKIVYKVIGIEKSDQKKENPKPVYEVSANETGRIERPNPEEPGDPRVE